MWSVTATTAALRLTCDGIRSRMVGATDANGDAAGDMVEDISVGIGAWDGDEAAVCGIRWRRGVDGGMGDESGGRGEMGIGTDENS